MCFGNMKLWKAGASVSNPNNLLTGIPSGTVDLMKVNPPYYMRAGGYVKQVVGDKAKSIMALSKDLVDKYVGEVPHNREALESLAGVGRKTANVVLNVWFGEPTLAVDTHVMRISHRLDFSRGKTPLEIEKDLLKVLPANYAKNANHWLVLFGRYICKAQRPDCVECPIAAYCHCPDKRI